MPGVIARFSIVGLACLLAACTGLDIRTSTEQTYVEEHAHESADAEPAAGDGSDAGQSARDAAPAADETVVALVAPGAYPDSLARLKAALVAGAADALTPSEVGYYLDVQEANLRQALRDTDVIIRRGGERIVVTIPGDVAFASEAQRLKARGDDILEALAGVLAQYPMTAVAVHGHTDPSGDSEHNRGLSEKRALRVARGMVEGGVAAARVLAIGHGDSRPASNDVPPADRLPDRRLVLHLEAAVRPDAMQ